MIDQLPTPVPQQAQSASAAGRDRKQMSANKDEQAGSFEDIVSKTSRQQTRQDKTKGAQVDLEPQLDAQERSVHGRPKVAFEFSATLRRFGATEQAGAQVQGQVEGEIQGRAPAQVQTQAPGLIETQLQVKMAAKDAAKGAKETAKGADGADQTGKQADPALAKLVDKLKTGGQQAEQMARQSQQVARDAKADAEQSLTASDELGLLLGLSKEADARHDKKSVSTEKIEDADGDENETRPSALTAKTDIPRAEHIATAGVDAKFASNIHASDDKSSSQGDVVRLVSANGRGRAVEIEVTAAPDEAHHDTAKASNAAKFETATVLEARRYLGFMPEPNATALATAIKADPTWTEALQAAERPDLRTLGNTVTEVNTLKLQMNPENLGSMVASLKLKGEELTVELRVDTIEAYQQLSADHDDIVKGLQDQGFSIDKVTVQLNATDRTDTGADRDMARQGQAQRDGQAEQRDERNGRSNRNDDRREQHRWASPGTPSDGVAGDGRPDAGRSDNIYL